MANVIDEKILRGTDWNGYKGSRVQEYIENELNTKIGAIYKPEGATKIYCFSTTDDMEQFKATGDVSLAIAEFETISKYEVVLNDFETSVSVLKGTTGNTISFGFKIAETNLAPTEQYIAADSRARIEFSFTGAGNYDKFTTEIPVTPGDWTVVSENIDKYLRDGVNNISIKITGLTTLSTRTIASTYNIFDLDYRPNFNYINAIGGNLLEVPYSIQCSETKYIEFYIDGISKKVEQVTDIIKTGTIALDVQDLSIGEHTLMTRAYVLSSNDGKFYTPTHYYTFAKSGDSEPSFLMYTVLDTKQTLPNTGENLTITLTQFEQYSFDWSLYDYNGRKLDVKFEFNGKELPSTIVNSNGSNNTFTHRFLDGGNNLKLKIYAMDEGVEIFSHIIYFNVLESPTGVKETTDGLLLKLQAYGRRNTDNNRDVWKYESPNGDIYETTFNDFVWNAQQGWNEETESLVISNGAYIDINIQPMINDWAERGGTVEIDIETFDVEDDDAIICECKDNLEETKNAYFRITSTKAEFSTANGVSINTRYKDNERLKIAFIGNKAGTAEDDYLIYIVVNGVLERAAQFYPSDKMVSSAILSIGDKSGQCKTRLRSIRVYNKAISVDEAFNNYVVDSDDVQTIYENNNILKPGTTDIGFDEVANKLPVMIFTGNMPELVKNGQDKQYRYFDIEYINRKEPERNFVAFNAELKLQGTSSMGYPRKNFKLKTKDKNATKETLEASDFMLDPESEVGNKRLKRKSTDSLVDFGALTSNCFTFGADSDNPDNYSLLKNGKYRFRSTAHKADKWTLKADYMESSCSHNAAGGRSWNKIFKDTELNLSEESGYKNNTYRDDAIVIPTGDGITYNNGVLEYDRDGIHYKIPYNTTSISQQKNYVCRTDAQKICESENMEVVRTAVDAFPMVCFYRLNHEENQLVFMGQYNFVTDKSSYDSFGFEGVESKDEEDVMVYDASQVEVWEGLKNSNPISLFKTMDNWVNGWSETYESRYPDPDDYGKPDKPQYDASVGSPLYELSSWIVSTRHEDDTVYQGTLDIDATFAERINQYQYGYTEATKDSYKYDKGEGLVDNAENRQKKFNTEKWDHFDVWKLAGYYIYLMRYGAVDQFVKNTMLFTDGNGKYDPRPDKKYRKWFYINYDNDCLFGLRNNGELAFDWTLDRQTIDTKPAQDEDSGGVSQGNTYAMMGHDSTLWNNLERDDEFMRMVRDLDSAMSLAGLNYNNMIKEFDTDQTEQWCERIYNANERYKYIYAAKGLGDMTEKVDNLWMLQGTRRSHRRWWIANHFNLLDARWLSGDYKNNYVEIKTDCKSGTTFTAVAGEDYYYAWGQQKKIYESNIEKKKGETITFTFSTDQVQGDPVYVYAINKMSELDFSPLAEKIAAGSFGFHINNQNVANTLKKLIIGNKSVKNTVKNFVVSTWGILHNLEYLDVTNYEGITSLPLDSFQSLHTLLAKGTNLASFIPSKGSILDKVELPDQSITTLNLTDIIIKDFNEFKYKPNRTLNTLILSNTDKIGIEYFNFIVEPWIKSIGAATDPKEYYKRAKIDLSNIEWSFSSLNSIRLFADFKKYATDGNFSLKGHINLRACGNLSLDNIDEIKALFGENCFNPNTSALFIETPDSVFISGPTETVAGQTATFERIIYPDESSIAESITSVKYVIVEETNLSPIDNPDVLVDTNVGKNYIEVNNLNNIRNGLSITTKTIDGKQIGEVKSIEKRVGHDDNILVMVKMHVNTSLTPKFSVQKLRIIDPLYASNVTIKGDDSIYKSETYTFTIDLRAQNNIIPNGTYTSQWEITGSAISYISSSSVTNSSLTLTINSSEPEISDEMRIKVTVTNFDNSVVSYEKRVLMLNETVIMTDVSNPTVMAICHSQNWAISNNAMTKDEAQNVTDIGTVFAGKSTSFSFNEFKYFTNVTGLTDNAFSNSKITQITLPENLSIIGEGAFSDCNRLEAIGVYSDVGFIPELPENITVIPKNCFRNNISLKTLTLPKGLERIESFAFGGSSIKEICLFNEDNLDGRLLFPEYQEEKTIEIDGLAFELNQWTSSGTTNPLTRITVPRNWLINDTRVLLGKNIQDITVENGHTQYKVENGILFSKNGERLIRCVAKRKERIDEILIADIISRVDSYAFFASENVGYVEFPETIESYGLQSNAFENSLIERINLSNCVNLRRIEPETFNGCRNLKEVKLKNDGSLEEIGYKAFYNCTSLESINIPPTVTTLLSNSSGRSYTFGNCNALQELILPDSIVNSGGYVMESCANLENVVLPKNLSISSINYFIINCPKLETVRLPLFSYTNGEGESIIVNNGVNNLFFYNTPKLREYELHPDDNTLLVSEKDGILYNADKTELIKLPFAYTGYTVEEGIISINGLAFRGTALTELILPNSLTTLGAGALSELNITTIIIPSGVTTIPSDLFDNCTNLSEIIILGNIQNIGSRAFYRLNNLKTIILLTEIAPSLAGSGSDKYGGLSLHSFGSSFNTSEFYAGLANRYRGINVLYLPYGYTGYDSKEWTMPLTITHTYKGEVNNISNLPDTAEIGDVYKVINPISIGVDNIPNGYRLVKNEEGLWALTNNTFNIESNRLFFWDGDTWVAYGNGTNPFLSISSSEANQGRTNINVKKFCGFRIEMLPMSSTTVLLTVYHNGILMENNTLYAKSVSNGFKYSNDVVPSTIYENGKHRLLLNETVYAKEPIKLYSNSDCTEYIGEFLPIPYVTEYTVNTPLLGRNRILGSTSEIEEPLANITQKEYETLVSKINYLMEILNQK